MSVRLSRWELNGASSLRAEEGHELVATISLIGKQHKKWHINDILCNHLTPSKPINRVQLSSFRIKTKNDNRANHSNLNRLIMKAIKH